MSQSENNDQYSRQRKLIEVGDAGQERLQAHEFQWASELSRSARETAQLYAQRAGMSVSLVQQPSVHQAPIEQSNPVSALEQHLRHQVSRDLALGAACALENILSALSLKRPPT